MKITLDFEWLQDLLSHRHEPSEQELRTLAGQKERQHLEYKGGRLMDETSKAAADVRQAVAAFANSNGGTLVVGYDEASETFDGVPPSVGKQQIEDWAADVLRPLAPDLSPTPHIVSSHVGGKLVLIVAVARAPRLVPLVRGGELVYCLRLGHAIYDAPPWLVSDLLLGRRNQPILQATIRTTIQTSPLGGHVAPNMYSGAFHPEVIVENAGLLFAEDVRAGLIVWTLDSGRLEVPASLSAYIQADPPRDDQLARLLNLRHVRLKEDASVNLGPFEQRQLAPPGSSGIAVPVCDNLLWAALPASPLGALPAFAEDTHARRVRARGALELRSALYVLSRDAEPRGYQLDIWFDRETFGRLEGILSAVTTPRPIVSAEFIRPKGETI